MVVNRYTQLDAPLYNPMSMQELAFAPSFLRQRHDETNAATAQLVQQLGDYNVLDQYQDTARQYIDPLEQDINSMAENLATKGITESNAVSNLMGLSAKKQKLYGPSGEVGQLQARSKQYQDKVAEIKEFFKDEPLLAQYKIGQLNAGDASLDPDTNKLTLGEFKTPNYTRHIPQAEILDRLNDSISSLDASTLAEYGIQGVGRLGSFNDLYKVAQDKGVSLDRINALVNSMVAPEELASITQYGEPLGLSPQESLAQFQNQLNGMAASRAYSERDNRYFNVEDKAAVAALKKRTESSNRITVNPGLLVQRNIVDKLKSTGLRYSEDGSTIEKDNSFSTLAKEGIKYVWDHLGLLTNSANVVMFNAKLSSIDTERKMKEFVQESVQKDFNTSVSNFKEAYPELKDAPNKEVYEALQTSRNNFAELYSSVISPEDADFTKVNNQILGIGNNVGDFGRRSVYVNNMEVGTGDEFYKQLGYSTFKEFKEEGQPQIEPGITFGAKTPAAFVGNAYDKDGNSVSFAVQSPAEIARHGEAPNKLLQYVAKGEIFKEMDAVGAGNEFGAYLDEGNSLYYVYDVNSNQPVLVEAPKGYNPQDVMTYSENNPDNVITFNQITNRAIQDLFDSEDSNLLRK